MSVMGKSERLGMGINMHTVDGSGITVTGGRNEPPPMA